MGIAAIGCLERAGGSNICRAVCLSNNIDISGAIDGEIVQFGVIRRIVPSEVRPPQPLRIDVKIARSVILACREAQRIALQLKPAADHG